jgi:hypothetical protein
MLSGEFSLYLKLGFHHIAGWRAYDHILFVAALTAAYAPKDWRRIAWLVTAFTIGHSITLALATLDVVRVQASVVEPAIALTIVVTALVAIHDQRTGGADARVAWWRRYALAGGFGLIHGLGFSGYLRSLLGSGERITLPLFAFNVGLEIGQLLIVLCVLVLGVLVERYLKWARRDWVLVLGGATAGIGLTMVLNRLLDSA